MNYSATTHYGKNTSTGNNWGDAISPYLFEKLSGHKPNVRVLPEDRLSDGEHVLLIAGSILSHATKFTGIWGAGFISEHDLCRVKPLEIYAVRGPVTRKMLIKQGFNCPEVYGDPGLLFPKFYNPIVDKKFKYGIVPHYVDQKNPWIKRVAARPDVKVINIMNPDVLKFVDEVCSCENILSSSLHGLVCADAYGIPSLWITLSDKIHGAGFKFRDYFFSVGRNACDPVRVKEHMHFNEVCSAFYSYNIAIDLDLLLDACPIYTKS